MITCDSANHKLNYIYSCRLLAQVQVKIGKLEGERTKPNYKDVIENPSLNYSGVLQHNDLYVTTQIYANNQSVCMPVKTSYRYIDKQPWQWDEWLTLPLKISDLPRNSQLAITVWDIETPQRDDVPVCGATISLFDKYGEFRQGVFELRMWPNKMADGSNRTTTPGILSDNKELELEEGMGATSSLSSTGESSNSSSSSSSTNPAPVDEFPILDELDRLAKMSKYHSNGHMIKQDWLDRMTFKEIQNAIKKEKTNTFNSKFFYMTIELAQIKCEDTKYVVLYYEEDAEKIIQTVPTNDVFVVNDPELELDNIIELKHRKLEHSKQMGLFQMNLRPDTESRNLLTKIVNYPVTRILKREEQAIMWKYRYYLTQNKKALTKFLQCFDLNLEFEGNILNELLDRWQPMDIEDALELLGSKYRSYANIRSYAISRLRLASNEDLILYLLQLVQALRYENFSVPIDQLNQQNKILPNIESLLTSDSSNASGNSSNTTSTTSINKASSSNTLSTTASAATASVSTGSNSNNASQTDKSNDKTPPISTLTIEPNSTTVPTGAGSGSQQQQPASIQQLPGDNFSKRSNATSNTHNLRSFLLQRATQNEIVALCLYWYVKVEIKDNAKPNTVPNPQADASGGSNTVNNQNDPSRTNFQIFMDELMDSLRNGDQYAKYIYESILNQEKFLKSLNDVVKAVQKESGVRDKKVIKLRNLLTETGIKSLSSGTGTSANSSLLPSSSSSSSSFNLIHFDRAIPLILDPNIQIKGINVDKTTMFKSNLMPCKFVFKTVNSSEIDEYSVIYKIGDDLRQDQLALQMIALMDKLLKQENLDLKLTPYKVIATGIKEGFLQFVDAMPVSTILANDRSIKEYLRRNSPSETDKHGITAAAMDSYVRSSAGYMIITYILGVGDRHYDNILITKCGKILHIDFGYILGRDPKPFQPTIKWTKDMADGMGGKFGPDGKENKEYEDFKKYCCNAFLHLRRHANLIMNLFSLMVDANIPDIALEPDKTVKKIMDRFKLELSDEQAQLMLLKEIESNYDSIVGNITDIIHTYSTAQK